MRTNNLYQLIMSGDFDDVLKKHKLSGTVNSATDDPKTILVYNRVDGELIATTMREVADGSFEIYLPFRNDESLTVMCRDEGGDFNADIYDRLSLCTVTHEMLDEHATLVKGRRLQINDTIRINYSDDFATSSTYLIEEDLIGEIAKATVDPDGEFIFRESDDTPVEVENRNSLLVNDDSYMISADHNSVFRGGGEYTQELLEDGIVHDFFGDGSAQLTMPLDGRDYDLGGAHKMSQGDIKFHTTPDHGQMLYQDRLPVWDQNLALMMNYGFRDDEEYTLSFLFDCNGNAGNSNLPIFQSNNGIHLYFNYTYTTLYFQTANYNTSWNAYKSWYHATRYKPGQTYHITITFNNGFYTLFFNGVKISSIAGLDINPYNHASYNTSRDTVIGALYANASSYVPLFGMKHLRVFNKICSDAEVLQLYNDAILERSLRADINSITAMKYKDGIIGLNSPEEKRIIDIPTNESICDVTHKGITSHIDNIEFGNDYVGFNGGSLLHKADTKIDLIGGNAHGSESSLDFFCDITAEALAGANQVIWKSGDSVNGVAVGISAGQIGVFGRSAGVKTSVTVPVSSLTNGTQHRIHFSSGKLDIFDSLGVIVATATGTLTASDAIEQESLGGAADGSPLTDGSIGGDSPSDIFNGKIRELKTFVGGTSVVSPDGDLMMAAELGNTGQECKVVVEDWDASDNECTIWVTVPEIISSADTEIRLFFDNRQKYNNPHVENTGVAPSLPGGATQDEIDFRADLEADTVIEYTTDLTEAIKEFFIVIPVGTVSEDLTDFPLRIKLDKSCGTSGFNATDIFENNETFEKIIVSDEDGNKLYVEVSKWQKVPGFEYSMTFAYPYLNSAFAEYVSVNHYPYFTFDKARLLTGSYVDNQWLAPMNTITLKQRLNVRNPEMKGIFRLRMVNGSHNGGSFEVGVKNFSVFGTNSDKEFYNGNTDDFSQLYYMGTFLAEKSTTENYGEFRSYILTANTDVVFKYICFIFEDNHGDLNYVGVRRIEFDHDSRIVADGTSQDKVTIEPTLDTSNVKATSIYSAGYEGWRAFDTSTDLLATNVTNVSWTSANGQWTQQKLNVDLGSAQSIVNLALDNGHSTTTSTAIGIKTFRVYGTNESTAFDNTTYSNLDDLNLLGTFVADEHPYKAIGWTQNFSLPGTVAYRYYIIRIEDSYGISGYMSIRRAEFQVQGSVKDTVYDGRVASKYPTAFDGTKVKATTYYGTSYREWNAFDPSKSLIGVSENTAWLSTSAGVNVARRVNVDYTHPFVAVRLALHNYHYSGSYNTRGIKDFKVYGTNESTAFDETDPTVLTDLTELGSFRADMHYPADAESENYYPFLNDTAYRYYVIIADGTWGDAIMGIRRAVFQEKDEFDQILDAEGILFTKVPTIYKNKETVLKINYSPNNADNSAYIGLVGTTAASNVWSNDFFAVYHLDKPYDLATNTVRDSSGNNYHLNVTKTHSYNVETGAITFQNGGLKTDDFNMSITALTTEVYADPNIPSGYQILTASGQSYPYEYCLFLYSTGNTQYGNPGVAHGTWNNSWTNQDKFSHIAYRFHSVDVSGNADTDLYVDGTFHTQQICRVYSQTMANILIGSGEQEQSPWTGEVKEVRYSSVYRSDSWIQLTDKNLQDVAASVQEGSKNLLLNPLDGWENGFGVNIKIPAGSIASNTTNFDVPVIMKNSSGVNSYDFVDWFGHMMKSFSVTGNAIKHYSFGSGDGAAGFNSELIKYCSGPYMNPEGAVKFSGDGSDLITMNNIDRNGTYGKGFTFCAWINASTDVADHPASQYHGIMGFDYREFSLSLYNKNLYIYWGNGTNTMSYAITDFFSNGFAHVCVRAETTDPINNNGTYYVFINGKLFYTATNSYGTLKNPYQDYFTLGGNTYHPTRWFTGEISDFVYTDQLFTDEEIKRIYLRRFSETYTSKKYTTSVFESNDGSFNPMIGEDLNLISFDHSEDGQKIIYRFSFDKESYCVFKDGAWLKVVSKSDAVHGNTGSTNWHYRDIWDDWHDNGTELNDTISKSAEIYIMEGSDIEQLTRGNFDLIYNKATGIIDCSVSIKSDNKYSVPSAGRMMYNGKKYWTSELYDLEDITVTASKVHWSFAEYDDIDYNQFIKVYVKLDNDLLWTECINGNTIPVLSYGMDTAGRSMKFRAVWDFSLEPEFESKFDSKSFIFNVEV